MQDSDKKPTLKKSSRRDKVNAATTAFGGLLDLSGKSGLVNLPLRPTNVSRRKRRGGLVTDARVLRKEAVVARQKVMVETPGSELSEKPKK